MIDNFYMLLFDIGLLIQCLCQGYRMDEQTFYPHDGKHSMVVPKRLKKFLFLNKVECLKAAFVMEVVGYLEFFLVTIIFVIFLILNHFPDRRIVGPILASVMLLNGFYLAIISIYYDIKYKANKSKGSNINRKTDR